MSENEMPLRLFEVDLGSCTYWVIGETGAPAEMEAAIESVDGPLFSSDYEPHIEPEAVREVTEEEARRTVCRGDGDPDTDMWSAAIAQWRSGRERVVACSEWP